MKITIEKTKRINITESFSFTFYISEKLRDTINAQKTIDDYWSIELKPWRDRRSLKQNAKFHVTLRNFLTLCQRAANSTGHSVEDIKSIVKEEALKRNYPREVKKIFGRTITRPKPSSEATTEEMAILIDTAEEVISKIEGGIYD